MGKVDLKVSGLTRLTAALRTAQRVDLKDRVKQAAQIVADDARARVPTSSGAARDSLRAMAGGKNRAYVVGGKAKVAYYGWLDFGTRTPQRGQPRKVGPWAHSGKGPAKGRFIYPALAAKAEEVRKVIGDAMDDTIRKAGL